MPMTHSEMSDLLTILAGIDTLHSTQSQEKLAKKADAWLLILDDVEYPAALQAVTLHYRDPNAKSITAALTRTLAIRATTASVKPLSGSPDDRARRERACNSPECRCTHLECWNGFLDQEVELIRNDRKYKAHKRCPQCKAALEARSGVTVS